MTNPWDSDPIASPLDIGLQQEGITGPLAELARSVYHQESSGGHNTATSSAGAVGGMQILPGTFAEVADKGWDINDPIQNARAGIRYLNKMYEAGGNDPRMAAIGYYGGPGAIKAARNGQTRIDPRNPQAPDTFQYADQVVSRLPHDPGLVERAVNAVIPAAQADTLTDQPWLQDAQVGASKSAQAVPPSPSGNAAHGGVAGGFLQGLRDPIDAGAQLLRRAVPESVGSAVDEFGNYLADLGLPVARSQGVEGVDKILRDVNARYDADRGAAGRDGMDWARLGGNVVATAPLLAATPQALAAGLGRLGTGAAQGAMLGALQPVTGNPEKFWQDKAMQTTTGAAFGTVLPAASRALSPFAAKAAGPALNLIREGVQLTPGQALGGALMRLEDRAMSLPIMGDAIRSARQRGNESLNRAVYNRVLEPIGESTRKLGREAVSEARQKIGQAYDDVLSNVQFTPDNAFSQSVANLRGMAQELPARERRAFDQVLSREVLEPLSKGRSVDGMAFKEIESQLGKESTRYGSSTDGHQQKLGDAIGELQRALRENLQRMNPQYAQRLKDVNTAYANFVRLENAAGKIGAHEGVFTPQQLANAIRSTDRSARKGAYSRGDALMQDLSDAAQSRMSAQIPDSGTAGRLMNGAALGSYLINPMIPAALGAGAVPYLPGLSRLATGLVTRRPGSAKALGQALDRLPAGLLGALAGQTQ